MFELGVEQVRRMPIGTMAAMLDALTAGAVASADEASAEAMVLASQMVINAMGAIQAQSIASLAAREREQAASVAGTPPEGLARDAGAPVDEWEFLGDRIAPLLAMTGRGAQSRVDLACELTRRLPRTLAAMRAGGLDTYRAGIIATQASLVRPHLVPTLEEHLFPDAAVDTPGPQVPDARDLHSTRLKARLRRLTARIDPQSIDRRCEQARRDRFVAIGPGVTPGITHWSADLPVEDSMKAWAAIDALAHDYVHQTPRSDGRRRTLTQARADAMVDLLMGAATVSTTLQVTVPLEVVEGGEAEEVANTAVAAADPAVTRRRRGPDLTQLRELAIPAATGVAVAVPLGVEVPRHGLLPLVQAQSLAREPGTTLTALFTDSRTGRRLPGQDPGGDSPGAVPAGSAMSGMPAAPAASGKPSSSVLSGTAPSSTVSGAPAEPPTQRYRPSAATDRAVRARDRTCRFPGCSMASQRCDLDHVIRFPDGPTAEGNLHTLCHHHRLKHHTRWRVSMDDEAVCTWTSPSGQVYRTTPFDHRELMI